MNRFWCRNLVTIVSTRCDNEAVISDFNISASPSNSFPDIIGPIMLLIVGFERIMLKRSWISAEHKKEEDSK